MSTRIQNQLVSKQIIVITGGVGAWSMYGGWKETYKNRDWVHVENRNVFYFILFFYLLIFFLSRVRIEKERGGEGGRERERERL